MPRTDDAERPLGIYLVSLYFVLAGGLETIQKYREWDVPLSLNPLSEQSAWQLGVHFSIYLIFAYLIWQFAALGRIGALVYGYLTVGTYVVSLTIFLFYDGDAPLTVTPLFVSIGIFHVTALIPVIAYLQPARQKKIFEMRLLELLFPGD